MTKAGGVFFQAAEQLLGGLVVSQISWRVFIFVYVCADGRL